MNTPQPALRPYLEIIEKQCQLLDRDKLIQLILDLAKQIDPSKRNEYLKILYTQLATENNQTAKDSKLDLQQTLAEIAELHESIRARALSINDGSYWDDPDNDDWDDGYYHDHDPEPINDEQTEAITFFSAKLITTLFMVRRRPRERSIADFLCQAKP